MRVLRFLCVVLATTLLFCSGQTQQEKPQTDGISWIKDYQEGLKQAKETGKPIFMLFTADWCGPCRALKAGPLKDKVVVEASQDLVCIYIDIDKDQKTPDKYNVKGIPSMFFLKPDGTQIEKFDDRSASGIARRMNEIADQHTSIIWKKNLQTVIKEESGKPILVFVKGGEECCDKPLLDKLEQDKELRPYARRFVFVEEKSDYGKKLKLGKLPAIVIVDQQNEVLDKIEGKEAEPEDIKEVLNEALAKFKSRNTVLMIIASDKFRDEELFEPKEVFENKKLKVVIASSKRGEITGMLGGKITSDILLENVNVDEYGIIVFVGGTGAKEYFENETAHKIAREVVDKGKVLGAICIAPVILANAGLLKGKKATVWKDQKDAIEQKGAKYTGKSVEVDGNIITAEGPKAAKEFARKILETLKKK